MKKKKKSASYNYKNKLAIYLITYINLINKKTNCVIPYFAKLCTYIYIFIHIHIYTVVLPLIYTSYNIFLLLIIISFFNFFLQT